MGKVGYVLITLAMVGYAVAVLFLDFYSFEVPAPSGATYFDLLTSPGPTSTEPLSVPYCSCQPSTR